MQRDQCPLENMSARKKQKMEGDLVFETLVGDEDTYKTFVDRNPEMDFASRELATQPNTSMSHSLPTKLTTHVTFGKNFIAAKYIINEHEKDGFKMLYDLLALVHPKLAHDLAQGPKNPVFEGDLNNYMTKFINFMDYEQMRGRIYDDHEQADYILSALKSSKWYDKLKLGLDEVTHKLDIWKPIFGNAAHRGVIRISLLKSKCRKLHYHVRVLCKEY